MGTALGQFQLRPAVEQLEQLAERVAQLAQRLAKLVAAYRAA
jgi:ubiquinone biosynthesis protein UbiJ